MQKPTFSLDCPGGAVEQGEHLDFPPTEFLECDGFHLLAVMGDTLIVCVHDQVGNARHFAMPSSARECLPEDEELVDHFERIMRAPHN